MDQALLDIPFDHFQRYSTAARILEALGLDGGRVLEVGANRQKLLGRFLPNATMLYSDIQNQGEERDFVVADVTDLPFQGGMFDAVVALDMLEHIPVELRAKALTEMARVAHQAVVVGCPVDQPWVHSAEKNANNFWHELFSEDYEWLAEHMEFGLVDPCGVMLELERVGMQVERIGHGDPVLWSDLMALHFAKVKFLEMEPVVAAMDRLYNSRMCQADVGPRCYREYFVALHPVRDVGALRNIARTNAHHDDEIALILKLVSSGVRAFASRTLRAELGWRNAVAAADERSVDLIEAKAKWEASARMVQEVETALAEATVQWKTSSEMVRVVEAHLATARAQWEESARMVRDAQADLEVAKAEWSATVGLLNVQTIAAQEAAKKLNNCEQELSHARAHAIAVEGALLSTQSDLESAKREWSSTAALVRLRETELIDSREQIRVSEQKADWQKQNDEWRLTRAAWLGGLSAVIAFVMGVVFARNLL